MKKYFYTIIGLFFCLSSALAQEHYYWAYGKKYPLEVYAEKQYILLKGDNKDFVAQALGISKQEVSDLKPLTISKTIKNNLSVKSANDNGLHWGFVDRSLSKEIVQSSNIIYAAPHFRVNGKEISISQFFYVKLKEDQDIEQLESLAKENNVKIIGNDSFMPLWWILSCDKNSKGNALEMANLFYETGVFASGQPDFMEDYGASCRNDTFFSQQWHLNNTGQSGGTVGNDIRICQAWDITMGCANIIVAVLDQGIEIHPDINNISPISFDSETGATPATTIYGRHGVAVAGVIGATTNNGLGVAGVAPNTQLMSINNSIASTPLSRQNRAAGINFAWQNGASVINNSWGSAVVFQIIDDAIQNAVTLGRNGLGTVVVFASGNDNNSSIGYPSSNANTISVGAIGRTASRASFSNFGTGLDVVAPGVEITTTDRAGTAGFNTAVSPGGDITTVDGTSFAAPQVSGIAALILSINPNLTLQQVRNIIQSTTDKVGGVTYTLNAGEQAGLTWNNQMGYGRVNASSALQATLQTITVSGPTLVCTNSTFTLNNPPPGAVTWSVTPSNLVSPSNGTGAVANVTKISNGNAVITFSMGCANVNRSLSFHTGPYSSSDYQISGPSSSLCKSNVYYSIPSLSGVTSINWIWPSGWTYISGQGTTNLALKTGSSSGLVGVGVNNTCGPSGSYATKYVTVSGSCPLSLSSLSLYPNPASSELTVSFIDADTTTDITTTSNQEFESTYEVKIYDQYQELIYATQTDRQKFTISTSNFPNGAYILNILNLEGIIQRKIFINKN